MNDEADIAARLARIERLMEDRVAQANEALALQREALQAQRRVLSNLRGWVWSPYVRSL